MLTYLAIVALLFALTGGFTVNRKDKCDVKLADSISKFVTSSVGHSHNFLFYMMGLETEHRVDVDAIRQLGKVLQLDLVDPGQQRELAIILCHAPSLTFLSRTFEVNFEVVDNFMDTFVKKVYHNKTLDVMFTLGEIIMEMFQWTKETGYPITPLEHQNGDDLLYFLHAMEERLDVIEDVKELWTKHNAHFPLALSMDLGEVALLLTGEHSLTRIADSLDLPALELETLSNLDDTMLHQYIVNVAATLRLYDVARDYGLLELRWD